MPFIDQLKKRLQNQNNQAPPTLIDLNFLNDLELAEIKEKVLTLKEHWSYFEHNQNDAIQVRFLSAAMYSFPSLNDYKEHVTKIKPLMKENFFSLYEKIRLKVEDYFNVPAEYYEKFHYPGFHIFALENNKTFGNYPWFKFHYDIFNLTRDLKSTGNIFSIIVPIELPSTGGCLLYTNNDKNPIEDHGIFEYKKGMIAVWNGALFHAIQPFNLSKDEYRITLQLHVYLTQHKATVFW